MTHIATFLSERLAEIEDEALVAAAVIADVDASTARRARAGEPVKAMDCLRLLAALGRDPVTRKVVPPRRLGRFDHECLRLFLIMQMNLRSHSVRAAADAMDAAPTAVQNMRQGRCVSLGNILKACAYLDIHPFECCERVNDSKAAA